MMLQTTREYISFYMVISFHNQEKNQNTTSYLKNVILSASEGSLGQEAETLRSQQTLPQSDMLRLFLQKERSYD